jgi:acyl carrier protein
MTEKELCNLIAEALELNRNDISLESSVESIDAWDSLGHISILVRLDDELGSVTERIPGLASAASVKEILRLLQESSV